ncbi:DUF1800 domain-containing protein [Variovorax sp. NFACC27]|uniref:DUF1800 domain-containing protein n=1 Tax=unclassified Variovorax TaxID=663243 RepID=UPI00089D35C5|nr:Uncharacterized conserved protein, DUF1800 family [Variovorax sp. NFACC28]SEG69423.1 Uncharacterized conserved protein, DUF1800 family [Variovorax sp. NFACC29]SFC84491.1 Uncharacterized conserved protein, DUF1800 family [Variovorax sp. NFACC26]SFF97491.1 Uncharacterized conserved protein, DUF1800 family [Variovorax sp. NFACC27]
MLEQLEAERARPADEVVYVAETAATGEHRAIQDGSRPLKVAAAFSMAAALAACGGGGGGGGSAGVGFPIGGLPGSNPGPGTTPDNGPYHYPQAQNDAEAARFLLQAQFSASDAEIAAVRAKGYMPWLSEQLGAARQPSAWEWVNSKPYETVNADAMIWRQLMTAADPVRKRMALALSEIFVVSGTEIGSSWPTSMMAQYWDMLANGVTGNFRQLLEDVTLNPAMGFYLNTRGNRKEDNSGRQPDENYAREVMQLMTIGLYQLESNGTVKTGADGQPIETYVQSDVTNLARVFTGYDLDIRAAERNAFRPPNASYTIETNAWTTRPMAYTAANHSMLEARFLGATVPAGTAGPAALKIALDTLFNHPNVGPFIGRQLIQRLVTSNPSPAYVKRVADTFANNGAGVRGDMKSVFAAVLLDDEARGPAGLSDPNFGHLREPMLRLVQWGRTFGVGSTLDTWDIGNTSDPSQSLGQCPLRSPSVFNFFRPGYVPPSTSIASNKMVAPEFQLVNETSVGGYLNFLQGILQNGFDSKDVIATYAAEKALVTDPAALVRRLNLLLTGNQLSAATVALITDALSKAPLVNPSTDARRLDLICAGVLLVMGSPEYLVQK